MSDHRPRYPPDGVRSSRSRRRGPTPSVGNPREKDAPSARTPPPRRRDSDSWGTKWWDTEYYISPRSPQRWAREREALENEHYRYSSPAPYGPLPQDAEAWASEQHPYPPTASEPDARGWQREDPDHDVLEHEDRQRGVLEHEHYRYGSPEVRRRHAEAWKAWEAWASTYRGSPATDELQVPASPQSGPLTALVSQFETAESAALGSRAGTSRSAAPKTSSSPATASHPTATALGSRFDDQELVDDAAGRRRSLPLLLGAVMLLVGGGVGGAFLLGREDQDNDSGTRNAASQAVDPTERDPATTVPATTEGPPETTTTTTDPVDQTSAPSTTTAVTETTVPATSDGSASPGPPRAPTPDQSPEEVAEAYFDALMSGDCETAIAYASQSMIERNGGREAMLQNCEATASQMEMVGDRMQFQDFVLVDQTADTATVEAVVLVDMGNGPQEQRQPLDLVLEDGAWKFSQW